MTRTILSFVSCFSAPSGSLSRDTRRVKALEGYPQYARNLIVNCGHGDGKRAHQLPLAILRVEEMPIFDTQARTYLFFELIELGDNLIPMNIVALPVASAGMFPRVTITGSRVLLPPPPSFNLSLHNTKVSSKERDHIIKPKKNRETREEICDAFQTSNQDIWLYICHKDAICFFFLISLIQTHPR